MDRQPCVYILASRRHGTLYVGVTSNLFARLTQHREKLISGFTSRYGVARLVHVEVTESMAGAIHREKQLKAWKRDWKIALIEKANPNWEDRAIEWGFAPLEPHRATRSPFKSS